MLIRSDVNCLKSVQIRSFFWSVFSGIRTEYGEINLKSRDLNPFYLTNFYLNPMKTSENKSVSSDIKFLNQKGTTEAAQHKCFIK